MGGVGEEPGTPTGAIDRERIVRQFPAALRGSSAYSSSASAASSIVGKRLSGSRARAQAITGSTPRGTPSKSAGSGGGGGALCPGSLARTVGSLRRATGSRASERISAMRSPIDGTSSATSCASTVIASRRRHGRYPQRSSYDVSAHEN